jgi:hypothetical protein
MEWICVREPAKECIVDELFFVFPDLDLSSYCNKGFREDAGLLRLNIFTFLCPLPVVSSGFSTDR